MKLVRSDISGVHGSLAPAVNDTDRICRHVDTTFVITSRFGLVGATNWRIPK